MPVQTTSDADLLQRFAQTCDRDALDTLFTRHSGFAFRTALLILRNPAAAEEAVQEACLDLIQGAGTYDPERPFLPWLKTLVARAALEQVRSDRRRFLPWGLCGGRPGTPSWNYVNPGDGVAPLNSKITMTIRAGDLYRHVTGGGGGFGPPRRRDPALVAADVRNEKLSPVLAEREYGIVLRPGTAEVDGEATARLRAGLATASSPTSPWREGSA